MATRRETKQRQLALHEALRQACREGALQPGELLPSVRELAAQYELSLDVVSQALQKLVQEGLLYTVPRVGTFVGRPRELTASFFLMLTAPHTVPQAALSQLQTGFEERIAQRGGATLVLSLKTALEYRQRSELPALAGVLDLAYEPGAPETWGHSRDIARVGFAGRIEDEAHTDVVSFDDVDGGHQATRHLLDLGHQRIAYLGLHSPQNPGPRLWSAQREQGWRQALLLAGYSAEGLAYHLKVDPAHGDYSAEIRAVCEAAVPLVQRPDITAVVAANDHTAMGLFEALRSHGVPSEHWPAVVGFDNLPALSGHVLTSLRLPWEEVGRVAADLLWERSHGQRSGPPVHRQAAMRLISRLTSRPDWSLLTGHAALAAAVH